MDKEIKEIPFEIKTEDIQEDGTFKGYGSTFGGKPDSYGDVVEKGAFVDSLAKGGYDGKGVKMLWQHNSDQPIGVWTKLEEDKKGLYVEGKLIKGVQQADEAYLLMKDNALSGLSIGYNTVESNYDKGKDIRYLEKVNLFEISPVTFGANVSAQITSVKSVIKDAKNVRELERALRDSGLSISESKYIIHMCKSYMRDMDGLEKVLKTLRNTNKDFETK